MLWVALGIGLASSAQAQLNDLRFDRVEVYDLARVVLGEILKRPFVVDPGLLTSGHSTSVDLVGGSREQVEGLLVEVLRQAGYGLREVGGVWTVEKLRDARIGQKVWSYRPKYRAVSYLENGVRAFAFRGRFAGITSVAGHAVSPAPGGAALGPGQMVSGGSAALSGPAQTTQITPGGGIAAGSADVLIYQGPDDELAMVQELVSALDVAPAEVVIRATVFEVQTSKNESSGVAIAYSLLGGALSGGVGSVVSPVLRFAKGGFDLAVSKLASDSRFNLVSSPSLRVTTGESARVVVGQDVPVLGGVTVPVGGAPVQSVNYQSSGVMLDISPVALEHSVKVTLKQEISDFAATSTGVNTSPTLLKRAVSSVVSMQSGEVVFIGGLDETNGTRSISGASWLPEWMRSKNGGQTKTELVVMLQVDVLR